MNTLSKQIGGSHYQGYKVQPITWALDNHINAAEFSVLRYLLRYQDKNGIEDLDKATHYTQILMQQTFVVINQDAFLTVDDFCFMNDLVGCQHAALVALFNHDYIEVLNIIKAMRVYYEQG